jgi:hypothetical protein
MIQIKCFQFMDLVLVFVSQMGRTHQLNIAFLFMAVVQRFMVLMVRHSLTHSFTYLLTHSLTHSLTFSLTYLLTHVGILQAYNDGISNIQLSGPTLFGPLINTCKTPHSYPLTHSLTHSLTRSY